MFVSQSSLSKQISDLEQELGVLLFRRSKHNVELTEAGLLLMDEAKAILLRSEKLAPLLQQADQGVSRTICLYRHRRQGRTVILWSI